MSAAVSGSSQMGRQALAAGAVVQLLVNECIAVKAEQGSAVGAARHNAPAGCPGWAPCCRCERPPAAAVLLRKGLIAAKAVL